MEREARQSRASDDDALRDVRPAPPTAQQTLWDAAIERRDALADVMRRTAAEAGLAPLLVGSGPHEHPAWARLEVWRARAGDSPPGAPAHARTELTLQVEPRPFRRAPLVVLVRLRRDGRTVEWRDRVRFDERDAARWSRAALGVGSPPWRYRPFLERILRILAAPLPLLYGPNANPIARPYRDWSPFGPAALISFAGVGAILYGQSLIGAGGDPWAGGPASAAGVALLLVGAVVRARRELLVSVVQRPARPPRRLRPLDSWQTAIPAMGDAEEAARERLWALLAGVQSAVIAVGAERRLVFDPGPADADPARERMALTRGQALALVDVYAVGGHLIVGWESFLNAAEWAETAPISVRRGWSRVLEHRSVEVAPRDPTADDLHDANALTELVHVLALEALRELLRERGAADQIDPRIIRGDRARALNPPEPVEPDDEDDAPAARDEI